MARAIPPLIIMRRSIIIIHMPIPGVPSYPKNHPGRERNMLDVPNYEYLHTLSIYSSIHQVNSATKEQLYL